jgi:hypothetical protein
MAQTELTVEFIIAPADFVAFQRYHLFSQRRRLWIMGVSFVLVLPILIVGGVNLAIAIGEHWAYSPDIWEMVGATAGLSALYAVVLFGSFYVRLRWLYPRKYAGPGFRHIMGPKRYAFTPEGIDAQSDIGTSMTRWSAIHRIGVGRNGVYFYLNPTLALILPRHALKSDEAWNEFVGRAQTLWRAALPEPDRVLHMDHVGGI